MNNVPRLWRGFSSVVAVGLLSVFIISAFNISGLPQSLHHEINFDNIDFVSNDQLRSVLSQTSATPAEVNEAVVLNEADGCAPRKATFLIVAIISIADDLPSQACRATSLAN